MEKTAFRVACALAAVLGAAGPAIAAPQLDLQFPGPSEITLQRSEALASFRLAVGPFQAGAIATQLAEGSLQQSAWRIADPGVTTLQMAQSLRAQIAAAGYKVMFECETVACGGYDFRYGTEILPEPDMHVDLGDFRYLAAKRTGPRGAEYVGLMISKSPDTGFVQLTQIGGETVPQLVASTKSADPAKQGTFALKPVLPQTPTDQSKTLDLGQSLVLEDLVFASGSSALVAKDYPSLTALAAWLKANPAQAVTLVGHTDASGGLAANIALSKKRAESVRQVLMANYGVATAQITANGVGPLAPRASNLSADGQQQNRRVEVVPTSTPN